MRAPVLLVGLCVAVAAVGGAPRAGERIVGGELASIARAPYAAALLMMFNDVWAQYCGAVVINNRSFLTAASCVRGFLPLTVAARAGSTYANSGGAVYEVGQLYLHPGYEPATVDNDVAVLRATRAVALGAAVRAASIAGANYALPDNLPVTVFGWGATAYLGLPSEHLRSVQVYTIGQAACAQRHAPRVVTEGMLCAGLLDVGGRDACVGDSGGPLVHNDVVVGVASWTQICGSPRYPFVYTRVPKFVNFITQHA